MSDFSYGDRARRRRRGGPIDIPKLVVGLLVGAVVVAGVVAALSVFRDGGEAAADSAQEAVGQIDDASDAEAQVVLTRAATAAQVAAAASIDGTPAPVTVEALAAAEPGLTFTTDASTDPDVVSVASTPDAWSAAVRSSSGICLWIRVDGGGSQTFGAGTPCTGAAAAAASDPSW